MIIVFGRTPIVWRIALIPTVIAFRDGQPVSMFIGAYPETELNRFVDSILPSEAEREAEAAFISHAGSVAGTTRAIVTVQHAR